TNIDVASYHHVRSGVPGPDGSIQLLRSLYAEHRRDVYAVDMCYSSGDGIYGVQLYSDGKGISISWFGLYLHKQIGTAPCGLPVRLGHAGGLPVAADDLLSAAGSLYQRIFSYD